MNTFIPTPGVYFYMQVRPWDRVIDGGLLGGESTVVKVQDRSYQDNIFYCVARDDTHVVSYRVFGGFAAERQRRLDKIAERIFEPVGPGVLAAIRSEFAFDPEADNQE